MCLQVRFKLLSRANAHCAEVDRQKKRGNRRHWRTGGALAVRPAADQTTIVLEDDQRTCNYSCARLLPD